MRITSWLVSRPAYSPRFSRHRRHPQASVLHCLNGISTPICIVPVERLWNKFRRWKRLALTVLRTKSGIFRSWLAALRNAAAPLRLYRSLALKRSAQLAIKASCSAVQSSWFVAGGSLRIMRGSASSTQSGMHPADPFKRT